MRGNTLYLIFMGMVFLGTGTVQAVEEISVFAGVEGRVNCPVVVDLPAGTTLSGEELKLVGENMEIPVTVIQQGNETQQLAFIISEMKPYEKQTFKLESGAAQQQQKVTIRIPAAHWNFPLTGSPSQPIIMKPVIRFPVRFLPGAGTGRYPHDSWISNGPSGR